MQTHGREAELLAYTLVSVSSSEAYGMFTQSSKRPANFQQMYSKYTC